MRACDEGLCVDSGGVGGFWEPLAFISLKCTFAFRRPPPSLPPFPKAKAKKKQKPPSPLTGLDDKKAAMQPHALVRFRGLILQLFGFLCCCALLPRTGHDVHFQFIHFHIIPSPPPFMFLSFLRPLPLLLLLLSFPLFLHAPLLLLCRPFTFRAPTLPLTLTPVRRGGGGGGRGGRGGRGGGR